MTHRPEGKIIEAICVALLLLACGCAPHRVVPVIAVMASYVGAPQFQPVSRTTVSYAANSSQEIIQDRNAYYLRENSLWFTSIGAQGPWARARAVPPEVIEVTCTRLGYNSPFDGSYQLCVGPVPKVWLHSSMWSW